MDILTFIILYLICTLVFFGVIALITYLIIRRKVKNISNINERALEYFLDRL